MFSGGLLIGWEQSAPINPVSQTHFPENTHKLHVTRKSHEIVLSSNQTYLATFYSEKVFPKNLWLRSTKISYFQVLIMLSMSPVVPSGATKSSELSPFALPQIPSKLPISKTEGTIWRCWIQLPFTLYFTEVPEGRVIYNFQIIISLNTNIIFLMNFK